MAVGLSNRTYTPDEIAGSERWAAVVNLCSPLDTQRDAVVLATVSMSADNGKFDTETHAIVQFAGPSGDLDTGPAVTAAGVTEVDFAVNYDTNAECIPTYNSYAWFGVNPQITANPEYPSANWGPVDAVVVLRGYYSPRHPDANPGIDAMLSKAHLQMTAGSFVNSSGVASLPLGAFGQNLPTEAWTDGHPNKATEDAILPGVTPNRSPNTDDAITPNVPPNGAAVSVGTLAGTCIVRNKAQCGGVDVSGQYLWGAGFVGADFTKARLEGAILAASDLTNAQMSSANLTGAALDAAWLVGTDFRQAKLDGVMMSDSNVTGANFTGASLEQSNPTVPAFVDGTTICPNGKNYGVGGDCPAAWGPSPSPS